MATPQSAKEHPPLAERSYLLRPPRPHKIYPATRARIELLAREGWSYMDIAADCGVSYNTARRYGRPAVAKVDPDMQLSSDDMRTLKVLLAHVAYVVCPQCKVMCFALANLMMPVCPRCNINIRPKLIEGLGTVGRRRR